MIPPRIVSTPVCCLLAIVFLAQGPACSAETPGPCDQEIFGRERQLMVEKQVRARGVRNPRVLKAMSTVGRHCFVPEVFVGNAYEDHPLPIGKGQTISQPYIVALMTELLDLKASDRVLEIGTGSGYQAAVLATLVKEVYSIEIIPSLGEEAAARLKALGYGNVTTRIGDGYQGWVEKGPFDAIMVTAAAKEIPPPLVEQLKPGGRMCLPLGTSSLVQRLTMVEKDREGSVSTREVLPVRFVPLVGEH